MGKIKLKASRNLFYYHGLTCIKDNDDEKNYIKHTRQNIPDKHFMRSMTTLHIDGIEMIAQWANKWVRQQVYDIPYHLQTP